MKYQRAILIFCLEAVVATTVFAQASAPVTKPSEDPLPVLSVPPGYHYDAHGRRDPFVNPIPPPPPAPPVPPKPDRPPGLKGVDLADVTLVGVLMSKTNPAMTRAIIRAPGFRAPILVSRGETFFDAVIKDIRQDSVVFTMMDPGNKPRTPSEEQVKKLRSTAGDKK